MASASGISGAHRLASIAQVASITARRQRDRFVVIGFAPDGAGGLAKLRAGRAASWSMRAASAPHGVARLSPAQG
jgi:hypothetical protein